MQNSAIDKLSQIGESRTSSYTNGGGVRWVKSAVLLEVTVLIEPKICSLILSEKI
jgi:hypothetical protein